MRGGGGLLAVGGPAAAAAARAGLLGAGAAPDAAAARTHAEPVTLVPADLRHPLVRALAGLAGRLGRSRFARTAGVDAAGGAVVLSFTDGAPALVDHAAGAGRVLLFASDLRNDGNDLPRRPEFVPFLHEMVGYLAVRSPPREFVIGAAPPGAPGEPGPARLPDAIGPIVLNVDTRESAFTALSDDAFLASVDRLARAADPESAEPAGPREAGPPQTAGPPEEAEQNLWRYLLIGMALVLVAEGLLAARTP